MLQYEIMRPPIPTPDTDHTYERVTDLRMSVKIPEEPEQNTKNEIDKEKIDNEDSKYYDYICPSALGIVYVPSPKRTSATRF